MAFFLSISFGWDLYHGAALFSFATNSSIYRELPNQFFCFFVGIVIYFLKDYPNKIAEQFGSWRFILDFLAVAFVVVALRFDHRSATLAWGFFVFVTLIPGSILQKTMTLNVFQWLGLRCYAIYLLQFAVIGIFESVVPHPSDPVVQNIVRYIFTFAMFLFVGNFLYRFIEQPFINYGKKFK